MAVISILFAFSSLSISRYSTSLTYIYSVEQVMNDIKYAQQLAVSSHNNTRVEFELGKEKYRILKGIDLIKEGSVNKKFKFSGKGNFSFNPNGYADVGGSGTLVIEGIKNPRKVIVSSMGRIRVEK